MSKERPWKRIARIEEVTFHNGDHKYETFPSLKGKEARGQFETLTEAEADLGAWFQTQVAKRRKA